MNLTDKEILELNELCNAIADATITQKQKARLSTWLAESEEVRRFYIRAMALSASLYRYASEMQSEAPDAFVPSSKIIRPAIWWGFGSLAAAACLVFVLWFATPTRHVEASASVKQDEFVARL